MTTVAIDNKNPNIYVAVDIEKTGSFIIKNPVISVGFYIADGTGNFIDKKEFKLAVKWPTPTRDKGIDYGDFEPRCWDEFWVKQPQVIKDSLRVNCKEQMYGWKDIGDYINTLEEKFPTNKITFLSDNASFDVATIDYNLEKYTGRAPMRYSTKGKYRSVKAADDMFDMVPDSSRKRELETTIKKLHTHNCADDAESIYWQYYGVLTLKDVQ